MSPIAPLVLTAVAVTVVGSAPSVENEVSSLDRALDSIKAHEIRSDLEFIASDEMKGRDTPSPEQRIAARYIRARLARLGFQHGAKGEKYLHEWTHAQWGTDLEKTWLRVEGLEDEPVELGWSKDYYIGRDGLGMREVEGGAVWASELTRSAVNGLEPKGRWVVGINPGALTSKRYEVLQEAGALGLIVLPPKKPKRPVAEAFRGIADRVTKPSLRRRHARSSDFPVIFMNERIGARIEAALPKRVKTGQKLDLKFHESCGHGQLDDAVLENVIGIWPGSDRKLRNEVIILSAHYDHVGVLSDGRINNGADDNGSGTCGLLAIAGALAEHGPMRRTIMLMWVSGEEKGLLGSRAWCKDPWLPDGMRPLCNINIDMIGRNASNEFLITPTKKHEAYSALTKVAEANARKEGFTRVGSADGYWKRSDQYNFESILGIPVAFLFCDVHDDYHKPTDTPEKIDYDKMRRICRLVVRMLDALQIDEPKF